MVVQFSEYQRRKGSEIQEQFASDAGLPPQSIELEICVLGAILCAGAIALDHLLEILEDKHFYLATHQTIYKAMVELYVQESPIDLATVCDRLSATGQLDKVGGKSKLFDYWQAGMNAHSPIAYAELLVEKWKRRQLSQICQEAIAMAHNEAIDWQEVIGRVEESVFGLTEASRKKGATHVSEVVYKEMETIEQRSQGIVESFIPTGFYDLDAKLMGGLKRKKLYIGAARPGMGKTNLVLNLARNIAAKGDGSVLFFSLEMDKEELVSRLWAAESRVEGGRIVSGQIKPDEWESVGQGASKVADLPVWIDDNPCITLPEIYSQARKLLKKEGISLIVIDYLQLMVKDEMNARQEISQITRRLKQMSKTLDVPIFALSQLSRGVESRANKRPMQSDLRESGSIEQDADVVVMLYRDEVYNPDTPDRGITELGIVKHRGGPTGVVKLLTELEYSLFRNLASTGAFERSQQYAPPQPAYLPPVSAPEPEGVISLPDDFDPDSEEGQRLIAMALGGAADDDDTDW